MSSVTVELTSAEVELLLEALDRKSEREHRDAQAAADLRESIAELKRLAWRDHAIDIELRWRRP